MERQKNCKEQIGANLNNRISDLEKLLSAYKDDPEKEVESLGTLDEYGLSFDYVSPNTFENQRRGYFRYQFSWGGPADEFRFFCDENLSPVRIEYWFLDWFDSTHVTLKGKDYCLLSDLFNIFKELGTVQIEFKESYSE